MGTALESFLNVLFIYFIARSVFQLFALIRAKNAVKNLEGQKLQVEPATQEEIEMVTDPICGRSIPRDKAYILAGEQGEQYFCSWDCRNKFISAQQE